MFTLDRLLALAFVFAALSDAIFGQLEGKIRGVVKDSQGALIVNATIVFKSETGQWSFLSNSNGEFRAELANRKYRVQALREGFYPQKFEA